MCQGHLEVNVVCASRSCGGQVHMEVKVT